MFRFKFFIISLLFFFSPFFVSADITKSTHVFAVKDGQELKMDIYSLDSIFSKKQPCLIFVFGGGFKGGTRDAKYYNTYFNYFAEKGFKVVSIDYRLGMKNQKAPTVYNNKPLRNAIALAVADLYSATEYLLKHADEFNIDTTKIIISGSSAGAITVLQADYEKRNNRESANILPQSFQYAGVISFAGAIFSEEGKPSYTLTPAPTLFFHGSGDKLVPYKKIRLFSLGMFGSKALAKHFRKQGYPYVFYSMEDIGHEVAFYPMNEFLPEVEHFIREMVFNKKQLMVDINLKDKLRKSNISLTPASYY
ncbi:MAG TPA: alpha/beta hydrolase fold domain-containing protein [Salinivirgaceae bacterium]|nr:alpha/beta hydrolase fold domain-containing protein [Salinivirgaceae bacterium]